MLPSFKLNLVMVCLFPPQVTTKPKPLRPAIPLVKLSNGVEIPSIGVTTWTGFSNKITSAADIEICDPKLEDSLNWAIDHDHRFIDAASWEGTSEIVIGAVVNSQLADYYITRQDLFISTKLSSYSHRREQVVPELQEALQRLQLEYVDLYLVHLPIALHLNNSVDDSLAPAGTWRGAMDALHLNMTRALGVAHAPIDVLRTVIDSGQAPHVLMIEMNLNLQQPELLAFCSEHNITVLAVNPYGSILSLDRELAEAPLPRLDDPLLAGIANKYGKTVPQIALRFLLDKGVIPVIPLLTHYQVEESLDIFNFKLDPYEMHLLKSFHNGYRTLDFKYWSRAKYYPFKDDKTTEGTDTKSSLYPAYYKFQFPLYNATTSTIRPPYGDM